jgi:hypothetical protein
MVEKMSAPAVAFDAEISVGDYIPVTLLDAEFLLRKKFPMLRFLRTVNKDPIEALELVFEEDSWERLQNTDMDAADLQSVVETVSASLVGGAKN